MSQTRSVMSGRRLRRSFREGLCARFAGEISFAARPRWARRGCSRHPSMAQTPRSDTTSSRLPARGEFTITNAYVMTMERDFGDFTGGSVHVRDGEIVAVGQGVSGGETIDGSGMIVMPGLVETHWHMWNTIFRSFAGDRQEEGYFPTVARFGQQMTPDDIFQSTRLSAAEAINSGMTFVHSWCHNVRSTAHAEADIRALSWRRHPRPPFLRLAARSARYAIGRSGADRNPGQKLEELFQRRAVDARHGLARAISRRPHQAGGLPAGIRQCPQARPADHRACGGGRASRREPGRTALQVETHGQGRSTYPCAGGYAGRTRHDRGIGRLDFDLAWL